MHVRRYFGFALLAVIVALAGCRNVPVQNIENAPIQLPDNMTLDKVKKGIVKAGLRKDWDMIEVEPGHLIAKVLVRGKHRAEVDIFFDTKQFSIQYKGSEKLEYDGETIHKNYNAWVQDLKYAIDNEMTLVGLSN